MQFNVEEENLICLYHNADRRRTMAKLHAALPDMDGEMAALARQTLAKLDTMTDADFEAYQFHCKRQIFQRISYSPVFLYNRSRKIFRLFHYNYGG